MQSFLFFLYLFFNFVGAIQKIPLQEDPFGNDYYRSEGQFHDDYDVRFLSNSNSSLSDFIDNTRIDSYNKSDWIFIGCIIGLAPIVIGLTFFFMFTTVADDDEEDEGTVVRRRRVRKPRVNKKYHRDLEESSQSENDANSDVSGHYSKFEEADLEQQKVVKHGDSSSHSDYSYDEQSLESYEKNIDSNLLR